MKINFDATYKNLSGFIFNKEAPADTATSKASFNGLLGSLVPSLLPDSSKTNTNSTTGPLLPQSQQPEVLTPPPLIPQYNFETPELVTAEVFPKIDPLDGPQPGQGGVKVPTVLSAQRVQVARAELPVNNKVQERASFASPASSQYAPIVEQAGMRHGIDPMLGMAIAQAESSFNPNAVSKDGHASKGLFQLLDTTGKDMLGRLDLSGKRYDPFNPELNTELGVGYLRYLHDIFSQPTELKNKMTTTPAANSASLEKLAVAAYNAGEGRVVSAQQRALAAGGDPSDFEQISGYLPEITRNYVARVMSFKEQYGETEGS